MQVILKEDIANLGYKDDVVTVKDGYGRNYLIPKGLAVIASPSALKVLAENQRQKAHKLAKIKGVDMPEVGLYHGEPNAFATGPSKNNSLVAVSDGLLASMNKEEVEAVLGHEMSHVANGDMVTMTLMQGVINTFVVFLSRVIGNIVDRGILRNESDAPGAGYYMTSMVLDMVLGLLGSMLVAAFSRYREYRADAGAAEALGSPVPMINALARLGGQQATELPGNVKGFGISGGMGSLFATHPPIEARIKALRELQN